MGQVIFYPGGSITNVTVVSAVATHTINTGALVAGVTKTVTHGYGLNDISLNFLNNGANDVDVNLLRLTPSDPTNKFDIQSGIDVP